MEDYSKFVNFSLAGFDGSYQTQKKYADDTPWPIILQDFLIFLESTGYMGVKSRVSVEDSPFLDERWEGPVHSDTSDDWK